MSALFNRQTSRPYSTKYTFIINQVEDYTSTVEVLKTFPKIAYIER